MSAQQTEHQVPPEVMDKLRKLLGKYNSLCTINTVEALHEADSCKDILIQQCLKWNISFKDIVNSGFVYGQEDINKARAHHIIRWVWNQGQWWNDNDPTDHSGPKPGDEYGFGPEYGRGSSGSSGSTGSTGSTGSGRASSSSSSHSSGSTGSSNSSGSSSKTSTVYTYKNWFNRGYSKGYSHKERFAPTDGTEALTKAWYNGYDAGERKARERGI